MPSIGQVVEQFWRSLPNELRHPCNPNNNGALNQPTWQSLLSPLVSESPGFRLGRYKNPRACDDPRGLRAVLDGLTPRIAAVSQVMPVLVVASDHLPGALAYRMDKLLALARTLTTPDGRVVISLDDSDVSRLIDQTFSSGHDDPEQPPPTLEALKRLLADEHRLAEVQRRLEKGWAHQQRYDLGQLPDVEAAEQAMLTASESDWDAHYGVYRDLDPWRELEARPRGARLADEQALSCPPLHDRTDEISTRPLNRSVVGRIRKRFDHTRKKEAYSFATHSRYETCGTLEVIEMAVDHACAPLGLPDRDARTLLAIGVWLDAHREDPSMHGWLINNYRAVLKSHGHLATANRDLMDALTDRFIDRLWSRLYGLVLFADEMPTTSKTLLRSLTSAVQDLHGPQAIPRKPGPTFPDDGAQGHDNALVEVLNNVVTDAVHPDAPVGVMRYLRRLKKQAAPRVEKQRKEAWQEIIDWQQQLHPEVALYPSYCQVCAFIRGQWPATGEETDDEI
jgi:hypothetical protein